ncbi:hypothetical protein E4K10_05085 [Streptomyces sp. T1317-0309]|nr:hypothetical protein E4K10_05085 [Streptomyces sp. T1317-0309]
MLKGAPGEFKKEFAAQTAQLTKLVAQNKSVSEGQVLEAGIVRSDAHSARVLVVADSKVTNTAAPEGQARTYRLQLDLTRVAGRWLTSDVAFWADPAVRPSMRRDTVANPPSAPAAPAHRPAAP